MNLNECAAATPPRLTVIVPTRSEERDVASLLDGLGPAVLGLGAEIIFVVDSAEDCPGALTSSAARSRVPVRLLCSPRAHWWTDRSSAVVAGARHARGEWILVMNAGRQHPPEAAATLASVAMRHDADIVIGTRYADGMSPSDCPGRLRRTLVGAATWLAKSAFPRRLAMVSDPLSGLFAFRAAGLRDDRLNPLAPRMLLEILVRHPSTRVAEVAYPVSPRRSGPRAPVYRGLQFLLDLARLRLSRLAGQLREKPATSAERTGQALRFMAFGMIGATGLAVNTAALSLFYNSDVDIALRVGDVGGRKPRRRAAMTEYTRPAAVGYTEHLGRIGANFRVHLGSPLSVEVGPLLARSCHVAYTNVVEPLLRFVMASRGRMLLHSACVEINGVGVMLSARTDTGKTGTVLRLLHEHGGRFLSDDMTVIDAHGNASCFPKPLTISAHTLRAVRAEDLTRSEWHRLQFQSRLHSRNGRSIGMALSRFNVPIMGINALTQMIIPPPKYSVDRLVPCRMASSTRVRELFIIERGTPRLAGLDREAALEQLIMNTDDAYGFPPFRYLAPAITIGGRDYQGLRLAEREILAQFLSHLRVRVLASDSFSWAPDSPRLVGHDTGLAAESSQTNRRRPDAWPRWDHDLAHRRAG